MPLVRFESMTGSFRSHRVYRLRRLIAALPHDPEGPRRNAALTSKTGGAPSRPAVDVLQTSEEIHRSPTSRVESLLEPYFGGRSRLNIDSEEVMFDPSLTRTRSSETPSIS